MTLHDVIIGITGVDVDVVAVRVLHALEGTFHERGDIVLGVNEWPATVSSAVLLNRESSGCEIAVDSVCNNKHFRLALRVSLKLE